MSRLRVAVGVLLLSGCVAHSDPAITAKKRAVKKPSTDVAGCYVTVAYKFGMPVPLFEPFIKIADKLSFSENGEAEVWGFRPWNLEPPDEHGQTTPVNILADRFIPAGKAQLVRLGSMERMVRCPTGFAGEQP